MHVFIFNKFGLKIPIHAPEMEVFGGSYAINGEQPYRDPEMTLSCV